MLKSAALVKTNPTEWPHFPIAIGAHGRGSDGVRCLWFGLACADLQVLLSAKNLVTIWPVAAERLSQASLSTRKSLREQVLPDVRVHHSGRGA